MYFPLKVSIPEPCHEDWHQMNPVEFNQRHCRSCDRVLTDFSTMTDVQIGSHLRRHGGNLCGRFRASQLNREIRAGESRRFGGWRAVAAASGLLLSLPLMSQQAPEKQTERIELREAKSNGKSTSSHQKVTPKNVTVRGRVFDAEGEGMIGATVLIMGTTTGTVADMDGQFSLIVSPNAPLVLGISYTGYVGQEVKISVEELQKYTTDPSVTITMNPMLEISCEVVFMGVVARRRSLPHRIFVAPVKRYVVWPTRRLIGNISEWREERRNTRPERKANRETHRLERQRESYAEEVSTMAPKTSTAPATAPEKVPQLTVSPNPFTDHLNVSFHLPTQQDYTLELFNPEGQAVIRQFGAGNAGEQNVQLVQKLTTLPAGTYFLRVGTKKGVIATEMLVK